MKKRVIFAGSLALLAGAWLMPGAARAAATSSTQLILLNGWANKSFGTAAASAVIVNNIVHFKGAISTTGTNSNPFVLPTGFRPAVDVYVAVDLCNATNGRLHITHAGIVTVEAETNFSNAQCFTSLDGASFARNSVSFKPLSVINGWSGGPYSTSGAAARSIDGVVHFKGAVSTSGTSSEPFKMPQADRPPSDVYVPIDLCNATKGRLLVQPSGDVTVQAEGDYSTAQCFTSLDGASFALAGFKPLALINGWAVTGFGTAAPGVKRANGVVQFQGAMSTSGTDSSPFVLPSSFRPKKTVYVPVDMCKAAKGRLMISAAGSVLVQAENSFSDAQCFTSLEGVSFVQ